MRYLPFLLFGKKPAILSFDLTIEEIIRSKKSFSRFGDGEIRMLLDAGEIGFQKRNLVLTDRLQEVLNNDNPNLLIGLPNTFQCVNHYTLDSQIFWYGFNMVYAKIFVKQLNLNRKYGDAIITRFYMAYKNKSDVQRKIEKLKTIWQNQNLLIIEGEKTKLGVGNDLFNNALTLERILCPSINAFDHYDDILKSAKKFGKDKLIMIALGPTASVLTSDLSKLNYWAIDIGHIDIEYTWFLQNKFRKSTVEGKAVNEAVENPSLRDLELKDDNYDTSIIEKIG